MAFFDFLFSRKKKLLKREEVIDSQVLDAVDILKESTELYLELLRIARVDDDGEAQTRLVNKMNAIIEHVNSGWDGSIKMKIIFELAQAESRKVFKANEIKMRDD